MGDFSKYFLVELVANSGLCTYTDSTNCPKTTAEKLEWRTVQENELKKNLHYGIVHGCCKPLPVLPSGQSNFLDFTRDILGSSLSEHQMGSCISQVWWVEDFL